MSDSLDFDNLFAEAPGAASVSAPEPEAAVEALVSHPAEQVQAEAPAVEAVAPQPAVERVDWKERAIREEERRTALERQLEQLRAAPPPQPQAETQPRAIPNPAVDPAGYHRFIEEQNLNHRLNMSETMAREKYPDLDDMVPKFKAAAEKDPALLQQLYAHAHPYDWAYKEMKRREGLAEIGDDPAAWREREREKLRAELAAESGQQQPAPQRPQARLPPNLTGLRSAADRSAPAYTGFEWNDLFPEVPTARSATHH
jgi:hypothetical protein